MGQTVYPAFSLVGGGKQWLAPAVNAPAVGCALVDYGPHPTAAFTRLMDWSPRPILMQPSSASSASTDYFAADGTWKPTGSTTAASVNAAFASRTGTPLNIQTDTSYLGGFEWDKAYFNGQNGTPVTPFPNAWRSRLVSGSFYGGGLVDDVWQIGYNIGRPYSSEPSMHLSMESQFSNIDAVSPRIFEFHLEGVMQDNAPYRIISAGIPRAGMVDRAMSGVGVFADAFNIGDFAQGQRILYNWVPSTSNLSSVYYTGKQQHLYGWNNVAYTQQLNSAGSAYYPLPYLDSNDNTVIRGTARIVGGGVEISEGSSAVRGYVRASLYDSTRLSVDGLLGLSLNAGGLERILLPETPTTFNYNVKLPLVNNAYGLLLEPIVAGYNSKPFVINRTSGAEAMSFALYNDGGGSAPYCTFNLGNSSVTGNLNIGKGGGITFNSNAADRWLVYTASSNELYFRDLVNGQMTLTLIPGTPANSYAEVVGRVKAFGPGIGNDYVGLSVANTSASNGSRTASIHMIPSSRFGSDPAGFTPRITARDFGGDATISMYPYDGSYAITEAVRFGNRSTRFYGNDSVLRAEIDHQQGWQTLTSGTSSIQLNAGAAGVDTHASLSLITDHGSTNLFNWHVDGKTYLDASGDFDQRNNGNVTIRTTSGGAVQLGPAQTIQFDPANRSMSLISGLGSTLLFNYTGDGKTYLDTYGYVFRVGGNAALSANATGRTFVGSPGADPGAQFTVGGNTSFQGNVDVTGTLSAVVFEPNYLRVPGTNAVTGTYVLATIGDNSIGFSGANDANSSHLIEHKGCSFAINGRSIYNFTGVRYGMQKEGTWNSVGVNAAFIVETSNGGGLSSDPVLTERLRIGSNGLMTVNGSILSDRMTLSGPTDGTSAKLSLTNTSTGGNGAGVFLSSNAGSKLGAVSLDGSGNLVIQSDSNVSAGMFFDHGGGGVLFRTKADYVNWFRMAGNASTTYLFGGADFQFVNNSTGLRPSVNAGHLFANDGVLRSVSSTYGYFAQLKLDEPNAAAEFFNNYAGTPLYGGWTWKNGLSPVTLRMTLRGDGVLVATGGIYANEEFRLGQGLTYSRVAHLDGAGGFGGGYNFNMNSSVANRDSTGAVSGYQYTGSSVRFFSESSGAPGAISPKFQITPTVTHTINAMEVYGDSVANKLAVWNNATKDYLRFAIDSNTGEATFAGNSGNMYIRPYGGAVQLIGDGYLNVCTTYTDMVFVTNHGGSVTYPLTFQDANSVFGGHVTSQYQLLSVDPSTLDIPSGSLRVVKNTTTGSISHWANNSGVMQPIGGVGGGPVFTTQSVTLTVPFTNGGDLIEIVVADALVSGTEVIDVKFDPNWDENCDLEEIQDSNIRIHAKAEVGQVRFYLTMDSPFVGPINVQYKEAV